MQERWDSRRVNDPESVTPEEAAHTFQLWWGLFDEEDYAEQKLEFLISHLARDLGRGDRCAVCLMTSAQAKAIGYDCIREC